ncbi:hypothetical protein GP2143_17811 [marine gamma proteobacterium HTCC2143]|uniref:Uncharacterized protein n=1 Tax=marine gamma proteobacterium HTCC2143 TaxID=247633 RepID=A0YAI2_9GAMM|nr:hypothetical protein GP2143_17811 [marine gamma proteobacterium HTCC2143]
MLVLSIAGDTQINYKRSNNITSSQMERRFPDSAKMERFWLPTTAALLPSAGASA